MPTSTSTTWPPALSCSSSASLPGKTDTPARSDLPVAPLGLDVAGACGRRFDQPRLAPAKRACRDAAMAAAVTDCAKETALHSLVRDRVAASAVGSQDSLLRTWGRVPLHVVQERFGATAYKREAPSSRIYVQGWLVPQFSELSVTDQARAH